MWLNSFYILSLIDNNNLEHVSPAWTHYIIEWLNN